MDNKGVLIKAFVTEFWISQRKNLEILTAEALRIKNAWLDGSTLRSRVGLKRIVERRVSSRLGCEILEDLVKSLYRDVYVLPSEDQWGLYPYDIAFQSTETYKYLFLPGFL